MIKSRIQLRNVSNVAASQTALIDIPCGPRYHMIELLHGYASGTNTLAGAQANITEIKVKVNGRVQRQFSATQLLDLNLLNGVGYTGTGVPNTAPGTSFPIFFAEPWRKDAKDQDVLAWPSAGWQSFQIEVTLSTASTPTLGVFAVVDNLAPQGVPGIVKVLRQSFAAAGTSYDISTLDRRDWLQQVSIYQDSGGTQTPTKVTLRRDGVILHELSYGANHAINSHYGMSPTASGRTATMYDLVLDHDDLLGSAVPMDNARDITLTIEAASAMSGNQTILVQRLGPPE